MNSLEMERKNSLQSTQQEIRGPSSSLEARANVHYISEKSSSGVGEFLCVPPPGMEYAPCKGEHSRLADMHLQEISMNYCEYKHHCGNLYQAFMGHGIYIQSNKKSPGQSHVP